MDEKGIDVMNVLDWVLQARVAFHIEGHVNYINKSAQTL